MAVAMAADIRIAADDTQYSVPAARLGLGYGYSGLNTLVSLVGPAMAKEIFFTARRYSAEEALAMGLVNRVVADGQVAKETRELLGRATRGSLASKAIGKRAFYRQVDLDTEDAYDWATEVMATSSQSDDAREGIRAFLEKRRPDFSDS